MHTPGPWTVDECCDASGAWTIRRADGSPNGDTDAQPIATVYADADAVAVAALPDMLAALKGLLGQRQINPARIAEASHLWDAVIEAVAAAEGRADG